MKAAELPAREADEAVAGANGVVEEGEGMVAGEGGEPEGELGEVHGHRVAVHAVEAALGDEAAGEEQLVFIRRHGRPSAVDTPRLDEGIAELAAGFHLECARADGHVADFEVEDLAVGRGRMGAMGRMRRASRRRRSRQASRRDEGN